MPICPRTEIQNFPGLRFGPARRMIARSCERANVVGWPNLVNRSPPSPGALEPGWQTIARSYERANVVGRPNGMSRSATDPGGPGLILRRVRGYRGRGVFIVCVFRDDRMRSLVYGGALSRSWAAGWPASIFAGLPRRDVGLWRAHSVLRTEREVTPFCRRATDASDGLFQSKLT